MTDMVILLSYLTKGQNRVKLKSSIEKVSIEEPFNSMIRDMIKLDAKADLKKIDLVKMASLHNLPSRTVEDLTKANGYIPDDAVAVLSINRLKYLDTLQRVTAIATSPEHIDDKISSLSKIITKNTPIAHTSPDIRTTKQLKPKKEIKPKLQAFNRGLYAGDLLLICAYPGIGKTNTTLCLAKEWAYKKQKIYYLSLRDWSWDKLGNKLKTAKFPDNVYWSVHSIINTIDIEAEINYIKPDVFIVDGLEYISSITDSEQLHVRLGEVAGQLKRIAQDRGIIGVITHQLSQFNLYPTANDLKDGKSHILAHPDLAVTLGGYSNSNKRNVCYIKIRNQEWHPTIEKVPMDYTNFELNLDKGTIREDTEDEQDTQRHDTRRGTERVRDDGKDIKRERDRGRNDRPTSRSRDRRR